MSDQVEITTNTGNKKMVSKEFAEAFNKAKEHSKSLGKDFGELNDIPIEEFEEKKIEKSILGEYGDKVKDFLSEVLKNKKEPNKIKGGLSDKLSVEDIAKKHGVEVNHIKSQLKMGLSVEMEHTDDPKKALEIAMDHMVESPDYYTKLKEMEESFED